MLLWCPACAVVWLGRAACATHVHSTAMARRTWYVFASVYLAEASVRPVSSSCWAWLRHVCNTQPWLGCAWSLVAGVADSSWAEGFNLQVAKDTVCIRCVAVSLCGHHEVVCDITMMLWGTPQPPFTVSGWHRAQQVTGQMWGEALAHCALPLTMHRDGCSPLHVYA